MSNWVLELQRFNIVPVWIRGETNILGDAPSRAPWENALADQLPIPDAPLREIIAKLYTQPPDFEKEIRLIATKRKLPQEWKPLREEGSDDTDAFKDQQADAPIRSLVIHRASGARGMMQLFVPARLTRCW